MNLTILRVFLNLGILNIEETNLTDPLVHAPKTNLTLNALQTLLLYSLINRCGCCNNLVGVWKINRGYCSVIYVPNMFVLEMLSVHTIKALK